MDSVECDVWDGNDKLFDFADSLIRRSDEPTREECLKMLYSGRRALISMHWDRFVASIPSENANMWEIRKKGEKYFTPAHKWMIDYLSSSKILFRKILVGMPIYRDGTGQWKLWRKGASGYSVHFIDTCCARIDMQKNGMPLWIKPLDEALIFHGKNNKESPWVTDRGQIYIPYLVVEPHIPK
jgi:hypothetical protein